MCWPTVSVFGKFIYSELVVTLQVDRVENIFNSCPTKTRFFEVSGVTFLSMLFSRYKVEILEEAKFAGETFEEKRARVTAWYSGISTT
jgi:hypothetical protein